jgi:hypothetical protein
MLYICMYRLSSIKYRVYNKLITKKNCYTIQVEGNQVAHIFNWAEKETAKGIFR